MKYIDEFRDGEVAQKLAVAIRREALAERRYHFMEFCGGHYPCDFPLRRVRSAAG
jgi:hydrogenase expression/formation protein HypD